MQGKIAILAIAAAFVAGCSDPKKASEENFEKAAQAYLDTQYPKRFVLTSFPVQTEDFDMSGRSKVLHAWPASELSKKQSSLERKFPKVCFQRRVLTSVIRTTLPTRAVSIIEMGFRNS